MISRLASRFFSVEGRRFYSRGSDYLNWDVVSAVCLERRPVITKELSDLEKQVLALYEDIDVENSLKSDFEVKGLNALAAPTTTSTFKGKVTSVLSLRDLLDGWEKELREVTLAPPTTEADTTHDIKSTERSLSSRLFLLVKQDDSGDRWLFPHGRCEEGETLRQSAERVLKLHCGPAVRARFLSNAPSGFFEYMYPKSYRSKEGSNDGAKVFFYKAELIGGTVKSDVYQWCTKSELLSIVDKKYAKSLDRFIFDDS